VEPTQFGALMIAPMGTMAVVLVGFLYNNSRLSDLRVDVARALADTRDVLRAEMDKNHSEMLHRFAGLDDRLTRIENSLGMKKE
jgi:hypothetical protein